MRGTAIISACQRYRYRLERDLGSSGRIAAVIMVNPSTADAETDDHSIRKCLGFANRLGISKLVVGNKFAFRATDIKKLPDVSDPVGPENDFHLEQILREADLHIVAWGRLAKLPRSLRHRWREVVQIANRVGCPLFCLGTNQDGHPTHPLMLKFETPLIDWRTPS
jgi:hypothetical protein